MASQHTHKHGFSLVELSIVLVILGLLSGGILTGQNLIRAAEVRSVISDMTRYQAAIMTFRGKYFAIPGDMTNATDFWGAADSSGTGGECANVLTNTGTGTQTCNGNGDGAIGLFTSSYTYNSEIYRFWQHLAAAGMVEGSYSGVHGAAGQLDAIIGENVPASKVRNAGFTVWNIGSMAQAGSSQFFEGEYGSAMLFGAKNGTSVTSAGVLNTDEGWSVDTKMDDGRPGMGKIRTNERHATSLCTSSNESSTSEWELTDTSVLCPLFFIIGI